MILPAQLLLSVLAWWAVLLGLSLSFSATLWCIVTYIPRLRDARGGRGYSRRGERRR